MLRADCMRMLEARTRASKFMASSACQADPVKRTRRPNVPASWKRPSRQPDFQKVEAASLTVSPPPARTEPHNHVEDVQSFEAMVANSPVPVLVDFYAPWCGPCRLMSQVISDISRDMEGDLKVFKIDTDTYPKLASKYRVQALPTTLLFRDGAVVDRVDGFMAEPSFGRRVRFYVARLDKKFGRR